MLDKNKIKEEAKQIMDNFMDALKDIDVEEDFILTRENSYREENIELQNQEIVDEFKNRFLSNAKNTKGDAIVANKGSWVEK